MDCKQKFSKAVKRLESKKRKLQTFLKLTEEKVKDDASELPLKQSKIDVEVDEDDTNIKSLEQLRQEKRARQKASMAKPKLYLTLEDLQVARKTPPSFSICQIPKAEPCYLPLFIMDLQHLLVYAIQGNTASYKPRWCKLLRWNKISRVIVLILNDVSVSEYNEFPDSFSFMRSTFEMKVEMVSPSDYGCSVLQELFHVPQSITQLRRSIMDRPRKEFKAKREEVKNIVQIEVEVLEEGVNSENKNDSITLLDLLLSPQQMIEEHYPLPVCVEQYPGYMYSKDKYEKVSKDCPMFAVDCEMCLTTSSKLEVTRVSVVNEKLEVVYETLVKPRNTIVNYMTRYSGITKSMLKGITTRLEHVQKTFRQILPVNAVLCGHSLNGDLHALKMYHPYVIDTSVIYNLAGQRRMKPGLKRLAFHFLQKNIQEGKTGHDPTEDACASMELVLLKLQKGYDFGDTVMAGYEFNQGTKSEEEELAQTANSMKKITDKEKESSECRDSTLESLKCPGCENCRKNEDSTGESDTDDTEVEGIDNSCTECGHNETDQPSESECKTHSGVTQNVDLAAGNKKTVFFERPGTKLGKHLCVVCKDNKHSVSLVGSDPEFSEAQENCNNEASSGNEAHSRGMVSHHSTTSDKKTASVTKKQFCSNFVTVASFHGFTPSCSEEEKKVKLQELDKSVGKILKHAPSSSLLCVVLGGHSDPLKSHSALALVKIAP